MKEQSNGQTIPVLRSVASPHARELVIKNHLTHDIYFGPNAFHNHLVYHILSAEALGADAKRLDEIVNDSSDVDPIPPRQPIQITTDNWRNFIGRGPESPRTNATPMLYRNFLEFFDQEVSRLGLKDALLTYGFDPALLPAIIAGAVHPLIHLGYGIEFNEPLIVAEGLAMACTHDPNFKEVIELRESGKQNIDLDKVEPILYILEQVRRDHRFNNLFRFEDDNKAGIVLQKASKDIAEYSLRWFVEANTTDLALRLTELYRASALVYAASSVRPTHFAEKPKLDFFLMHGLTSIFGVRQILPHLSIDDAAKLLELHWTCLLTYYIARGRPALHVETMLNYTRGTTPHDWTGIFQQAIHSSEAHVPKVVRALYQGEKEWGKLNKIWFVAAKMTVDVNGDWMFSPVGMEETWRHSEKKATMEVLEHIASAL